MRQQLVVRMCSCILTLIALQLTACDNEPKGADSTPLLIPIEQDTVYVEFAIYYLPEASTDPMPAVRAQLVGEYADLKLVSEMPDSITDRYLLAYMESDVQNEYAPPDLDSIKYFGQGLSLDQAKALQSSTQALILIFAHPKDKAMDCLPVANQLVEQVARATNGLIWDEGTREVFSSDAWHETRLAKWHEGLPDVTNHITIHAYSTGEYVRAITLGMSKFGLPDIVINEFSWSLQRSMGNLINVTAQAMVEGILPAAYGEADLDLRDLKHPVMRSENVDTLYDNAEAVAHLTLLEGTWEEGDPANALVQIGFDRYPGKDLYARQDKMLGAIWGWEDSITRIDHNEELLTASREAATHLPALRDAFNKGLQPGEYILLKAPFDTPKGGSEWMWVEVTSWQGNNIDGLLKNQPFDIPELHAGQNVKVNQDDVFDYIHHHADGTTSGNTTGEIIMKMQGSE